MLGMKFCLVSTKSTTEYDVGCGGNDIGAWQVPVVHIFPLLDKIKTSESEKIMF